MFLSPIMPHFSPANGLMTSLRRSPDIETLFVGSTYSLPRSSTVRALSDVLHCSPTLFHCDVSSIQVDDDYVTSSRIARLGDDDVVASVGERRRDGMTMFVINLYLM